MHLSFAATEVCDAIESLVITNLHKQKKRNVLQLKVKDFVLQSSLFHTYFCVPIYRSHMVKYYLIFTTRPFKRPYNFWQMNASRRLNYFYICLYTIIKCAIILFHDECWSSLMSINILPYLVIFNGLHITRSTGRVLACWVTPHVISGTLS